MFQYSCGRCGKQVEKSARVCPHCGAKLGNIHCRNCGYRGVQSDFVDDRCPRCKAAVRTTPVRYERCKECGRKLEVGQWTCPHCGHTQWGIVLGLAGVGIALIVLAIIFLPLPSVWIFLVGGAGLTLFFSAFYNIGVALHWRTLSTLFTTLIMLAAVGSASLGARYRYTPEKTILSSPEAVVAAAAPSETPLPLVSATPAPTQTPVPSATPSTYGFITAQVANLREGPSIDATWLAYLNQNETVTLLGRSADSGWIKVVTEKGVTGWVYAPLLQIPVDRGELKEVK